MTSTILTQSINRQTRKCFAFFVVLNLLLTLPAQALSTQELLSTIDLEGASAQVKIAAKAICNGATTYRDSGLGRCLTAIDEAIYIDRKIFDICAVSNDADLRYYCFKAGRNRFYTEAEIAGASLNYSELDKIGRPITTKILQAAKMFQKNSPIEFCKTFSGRAKNICTGTVFDNQDLKREINIGALTGCLMIDIEEQRSSCGQVVFANSLTKSRSAACLDGQLENINAAEFTECLATVGKPWSNIDPGNEDEDNHEPEEPVVIDDNHDHDGHGVCVLTAERVQMVTAELKDLAWTLDSAVYGNSGWRGNQLKLGATLEGKVIAEGLLEKLFLCRYGDLTPESSHRISHETKRKRREIRERHSAEEDHGHRN